MRKFYHHLTRNRILSELFSLVAILLFGLLHVRASDIKWEHPQCNLEHANSCNGGTLYKIYNLCIGHSPPCIVVVGLSRWQSIISTLECAHMRPDPCLLKQQNWVFLLPMHSILMLGFLAFNAYGMDTQHLSLSWTHVKLLKQCKKHLLCPLHC